MIRMYGTFESVLASYKPLNAPPQSPPTHHSPPPHSIDLSIIKQAVTIKFYTVPFAMRI